MDMIDLVGGGLTFTVSLLLTWLIRGYAVKKSLLDHPNHRSSHTMPTPRGGGLAIVLTFVSVLLFLLSQKNLESSACWALIIGGGLIAVVGWLDDCHQVSAGLRLAVHGLAVATGLSFLGGVPSLALAGLVIPAGAALNVAAGVCLVWLLNLFNFMDGIDGLAAMEASFAALGAALILFCQTGWSQDARLLLFFALAVFGFLAWNWPPAKIFMGDVGSGFLGYALGMAVVLTVQAGGLTLPVWLILLAAFGVDATLTLFGRMAKGERWWTAHCSHAYQGAARRYGKHKTVTLSVLFINCFWLLPLAFWANLRRDLGWPLLLASVLPLMALVLRERSLGEKDAN